MNKKIIDSYNETFDRYGDDPRSVHWGNMETQYLRFKILTGVADLNSGDCVVLDYGCGKGDLFFYLLFNGFNGKYIGVDINKKMIDFAADKFKNHPQASFRAISSEKDTAEFKYDYGFISGVFNENFKGNDRSMRNAVRSLYENSRRGVAFNALSTYAKKREAGMAYFNPADIFRFCMDKISQYAVLRHDYRGGNFTVYLYKHKGANF